jgi:hypothetical protein
MADKASDLSNEQRMASFVLDASDPIPAIASRILMSVEITDEGGRPPLHEDHF